MNISMSFWPTLTDLHSTLFQNEEIRKREADDGHDEAEVSWIKIKA